MGRGFLLWFLLTGLVLASFAYEMFVVGEIDLASPFTLLRAAWLLLHALSPVFDFLSILFEILQWLWSLIWPKKRNDEKS